MNQIAETNSVDGQIDSSDIAVIIAALEARNLTLCRSMAPYYGMPTADHAKTIQSERDQIARIIVRLNRR